MAGIESLSGEHLRQLIIKMHAAGAYIDPTILSAYVQKTGDYDLSNINIPPRSSSSSEPRKPTVSTERELPKQELLLKLLKMTTSDNDGECLTAIRKVNTLLTTNGWDWDKFVAGKIKIVENPFVGLGTPPRPSVTRPVGPATPPNPHTTRPFSPPPMAPLQGQKVRSLGTNKFADSCYCCGIDVIAGAGGFFKRADNNLNAANANPRSLFSVVCASCDGHKLIWDQPAARQRKRGQTSINDLM